MPIASPENTPRWTAQIQDMVASDSGIREGLHDQDAIPLIDWGRAQAERIAARLGAEAPDVGEETIGDEAGALIRLMTTISRAVVHRHNQGDDWLAKVFKRLNKTSQRVYGEDAPVMSDEEVAAWIAGHGARSDGEVLRDLMARFSPPETDAASTEPDQPPAPAAPLSAVLDGLITEKPESASPDTPPSASGDLPGRPPAKLPGRLPAADDLDDTDPSDPWHTGDEHGKA